MSCPLRLSPPPAPPMGRWRLCSTGWGSPPPVLPPSPGVLCHRACKAWCFATLHLSPPRPQQGASGVLSTQVTRGHRQRPPAADVGCTRPVWGAAACAPETFARARRPWPLPRGIREGPVCGLCLPWRPLMKVARRPVWVQSSVKAGGGRWARPSVPELRRRRGERPAGWHMWHAMRPHADCPPVTCRVRATRSRDVAGKISQEAGQLVQSVRRASGRGCAENRRQLCPRWGAGRFGVRSLKPGRSPKLASATEALAGSWRGSVGRPPLGRRAPATGVHPLRTGHLVYRLRKEASRRWPPDALHNQRGAWPRGPCTAVRPGAPGGIGGRPVDARLGHPPKSPTYLTERARRALLELSACGGV